MKKLFKSTYNSTAPVYDDITRSHIFHPIRWTARKVISKLNNDIKYFIVGK